MSRDQLVARLRYMGRQYASGRVSRGGEPEKHYLEDAADVIEAQAAQIEALTKDAERYREVRRGQHWSVIDGIGDVLRADALDSAIDSILANKEHE